MVTLAPRVLQITSLILARDTNINNKRVSLPFHRLGEVSGKPLRQKQLKFSILLYSAGSGVKRVAVDSTGFRMMSFSFDQE